MFIHIGAFVIATSIVTLELATFVTLDHLSLTTINVDWWLNFVLVESEIYLFGIFFSAVPLLIILDSLLDRGIAEKDE
jgi:hypothetical protein